jgi:hypothetical protein
MVSTLTLIALILFAVFAALAIIFTLLNRALKRHLTRVYTRWLDEGIQIVEGPAQANYRGHLTGLPVRGNGVLALTDRDLRFAQFAPAREFIVPLDQITRVTSRRGWRGSIRVGYPVIGVYYREGPTEIALGLMVQRSAHEAWLNAISRAANVPVETDR